MPGLIDFLLGGVLPTIIAMATFAIAWRTSRRVEVAWTMGVLVGFAAGFVALESLGLGVSPALRLLVQPTEAKHWAPAVALAAVVPALLAAFVPRGRWIDWLVAALLCAAAPVWLLWGSAYLPSAEVRASGFATNAWSAGQAAMILSGISIALFGGWRLWAAAEPGDSARLRSILAVVAITAAAVTAGLTGSFVYAQLFGVLAASVAGCAAGSWLCRAPGGPEAAAGPIIILAGCLLFLASCLSKLQPLQAAGLATAMVVAACWIPGFVRLSVRAQQIARIVLCLLPLTAVLWHAGNEFAETQRQKQKEAESNPYLNL